MKDQTAEMHSWAALALSQKKQIAMRLICIKGLKAGEKKDQPGVGDPLVQPGEALIEGEPYNAIWTRTVDGYKYYLLAGRTTVLYGFERFLPCSDIDEREILAARLDQGLKEIVEGLNA